MGITEVLRGDDLLGCTGWQLALYDALSLPRPAFAHVPLIHGPDGKRLAKRHGARSISEMRETGARPEAVVGWLAASCGLVEAGTELSAASLVGRFDLGRIRCEATTLAVDEMFR